MKKAILTTFLALFLICPLSAQNWSFLGGNDTLNFNEQDVLSLIVDSNARNNSVITFKEVLNDTISANFLNPVTSYYSKPNLLGKILIEKGDSSIIINQNGDSLYFNLEDVLGESSTIYTSSNGNRKLISTVDSTAPNLQHPGDTLKFFTFSYEDSIGTPVNNVINQKKLVISKFNGLMESPFWYHFPVNLAYFGKSNFRRVFVNLGITENNFYDYQIDDEYHLKESEYDVRNRPPFEPDNFSNQEIISKKLNPQKGTVTYETIVKLDIYDVYLASNLGPLLTRYTHKVDTVSIELPYTNKLALKGLGYQPIVVIDTANPANDFVSKVEIKVNQFDGRLRFTNQDAIYDKLNDSLLQKWTPVQYRIENKGQDIEGVCKFYGYRDYHNQHASYDIKELIYFRQGNYTWGNPRIVTGIDQEVELKKQSFQIFPNPTSSQVNIESKENIELIRIIDLKGQVQLEYHNPNLKNLDVSFLENGVYLLESHSENKEVKRQKLVIKH